MKLHEILFFFFECDNETLCIERPSLPGYRFWISKESPIITVMSYYMAKQSPGVSVTVVTDTLDQDGFFDSDFQFEDWRVWKPNKEKTPKLE